MKLVILLQTRKQIANSALEITSLSKTEENKHVKIQNKDSVYHFL
jgi:hypothetical protein